MVKLYCLNHNFILEEFKPVAYMAKTYHLFKVDKNKIEGSSIGHIVHGCQQYCSTFFTTLNLSTQTGKLVVCAEDFPCAFRILGAHMRSMENLGTQIFVYQPQGVQKRAKMQVLQYLQYFYNSYNIL